MIKVKLKLKPKPKPKPEINYADIIKDKELSPDEFQKEIQKIMQ